MTLPGEHARSASPGAPHALRLVSPWSHRPTPEVLVRQQWRVPISGYAPCLSKMLLDGYAIVGLITACRVR